MAKKEKKLTEDAQPETAQPEAPETAHPETEHKIFVEGGYTGAAADGGDPKQYLIHETIMPPSKDKHPGFVKLGDYWHKLNTAGNPMKQRYIEVEGKLCQIN
jgi:hypothetical protein